MTRIWRRRATSEVVRHVRLRRLRGSRDDCIPISASVWSWDPLSAQTLYDGVTYGFFQAVLRQVLKL
jgi:hypothetical protein